MTIHYYFSWFDEELPENLIQLLDEDLVDRKSLVMISGQPTTMETSNRNIVTDDWLPSRGIIEFAGEKTHYFNGEMIARRRTVRM